MTARRKPVDDPRCEHQPGMQIIVTNQPGAFDRNRSHRSVWVCNDPACVLDAMAWVSRGTGDEAWWRRGVPSDGFEWHQDMPTAEKTGFEQVSA